MRHVTGPGSVPDGSQEYWLTPSLDLESIRELVELENDGLVVSWPIGLIALDARRMLEARGT